MALLTPMAYSEKDALLTFLRSQREALKAAVHDLDREQAISTPSVSALNLAGLIKHTAEVERFWIQVVLAQGEAPAMEDYDGGFTLKDGESVADVLALADEVAARTEEIVRALPDLDVAVPVPKQFPWFPQDLDAWNARWVLLHMIEEVARHAGHADIVRESIDGSNAFVLLAKHQGDVPDYLKAYMETADA